ncbi:ScbR family autoregulator-binding transcription factor [Streptomyces sp. NPDC050161]|uniref:ScbR family autoregulator-binding transcription factor n=1 Tax=Streptomyces sp. NPDC050161 TaxID=3365604 RepID=UPI0037AC4C24
MAQPKQERAVRTRAAIIHAAAEVFDERGFNGASLSRILERAGATMGALYFHFASKEALAKAVMAEQAADLTLTPGEDGLQRLVHLTMDLARGMQHDVLLRAGVRLAVEQGGFGVRDSTAYELWIDEFRRQLVAARLRGELVAGVDEEDFARTLVGAYTGTQLLSKITTGHADLPARIASLWRYLLPAIATPQALSCLEVRVENGEALT